MKILFSSLTHRPTLGGVPTYMEEMAKRLRARGHEVSIRTVGLPLICEDFVIEPGDKYEWDGVSVQRIPFDRALRRDVFWSSVRANIWRKSNTVRLGKILGDRMGEAKVDLVHAYMVSWQDAYASFALARRLGVPVVFTPHLHPGKMDGVRNYCRPLLKEASSVIGLTDFERGIYIEEGVPAERVYSTGAGPSLMPQGDGARFREQHGIKGPMILFLARMEVYKNFLAVAEAARHVWPEFPEANFIFVGPKLHAAHRFFKRQKDPRIRSLGKVSLQEKTDALAACDLLCMPSGMESFGMTYCEAWSFGKPVIGGDVPAVRELIEKSQGGFLVKVHPARPKEIAARILDLLRDAALRTKMGESGRALVQKSYTWDALTVQTEKIYQETLARGKSA